MNKEKIKELIKMVQEFHGNLTLSYIPQTILDSTEKLYGLYYGGWYKIEIGDNYNKGNDSIKITNTNIDEIVDKINECLLDNIGNEILQALINLELDSEDIKYFDRDPELFKKFKKEVRKLKKENLK